MAKNYSQDTWQLKIANTINDIQKQIKALRTGQMTPEGWHNGSYASFWLDWGGGWGGAQYYKDGMGIVHLRGLVQKSGTITLGEVIFTLPAGYRPVQSEMFPVASQGGYASVSISTNGSVATSQGSTASSNWWSLDGITFRTA